MGQCKICGIELEDGKDVCETCQQDLEQVDVDLDGIGDIDLNLDLQDFELPELSGDLMETDLEFELDDPNNDLENPDIFVHDLIEDSSSSEDEIIPETISVEEPISASEEAMSTESFTEELASDIPDLPDDLGDLLSSVEENVANTVDEEVDLSGLLPDADIPDIGLEGLGLNEEKVSVSDEDKSFVDDILGSIDAGTGDVSSDTASAELSKDPLGGMTDDILNLFPSDGISETSAVESVMSETGMEPNLDILGAVPDAEEIAELAKPKEKISIWKRLFGNVKDEKWEKQKEKEEKEEKERLAKLEAQKAKEAEAAAEQEGTEGEPKIDPKEAKKAEKLAKKEEKARRKEEKKAEKQRLKELAELEDADEGRINRLGATIVFVSLGVVAVVVIIGTNIFSYKGSVSRASAYFKEDQYSAAYDEISGLNVKEKDQELYNQIRTVMFVNKELNSYRNYTGIRMYPEALDSLIKGLEKYDKHIEDAKDMDVSEDLDKVRGRIISELENEYGLTEKEAYKLLNTTDRESYSKKVIEIANQ